MACRASCNVYLSSNADTYSMLQACWAGCDLAALGGNSFCHCGCVAMNDVAGYEACLTGCELAVPATTISVSPTGAPPATSPTSATNGLETTTSGPSTSSNPPAACSDNDGAVVNFFEHLMGMSLNCSLAVSLHGCDATGLSIVGKSCPVSCGLCTAPPPREAASAWSPWLISVVVVCSVGLATFGTAALASRRSKRRVTIDSGHGLMFTNPSFDYAQFEQEAMD